MTTVLLHPSFILPSPFCFTSKSILNLSLYKKPILLWFYSTQSSENHAQILHQNKQKSKIESREIMQGSITQPTNSSILLVIEVMLCRQSILAKPPDRYLIKIPVFRTQNRQWLKLILINCVVKLTLIHHEAHTLTSTHKYTS